MVDIHKCIIIFCSVVFVSADLCYYHNGSIKGKIIRCPAACCGTEENPCCSDSGPLFLFAVAAIVSLALILLGVLVFCVQREYTRRKTMARQQQVCEKHIEQKNEFLSELYMASKQYHIVVFNANRSKNVMKQLELPPRYSDLYPVPSLSEESNPGLSDKTSLIGSRKFGFFGSLKRTSLFRKLGRTERKSQYKESTFDENPKYIRIDKKSKSNQIEENANCTKSFEYAKNSVTDNVAEIDLSDGESLMTTIAADLPEVFETNPNPA